MYHNPFVRYENTETKRMQVVFLKEHLKLSVEEISAITGYAVSTVRKYARKFLKLLKTAKKFFIQAKNSIVETVCDLLDDKKEKCYLFKFYDENNEILFSKVGTTTRKIIDRLREEIKEYKKSGFNVCKVKVCKVIDCGEIPAEGAESFVRARYIKKYQGTFQKNDRFMKIDIPTDDFTEAVMGYLAQPKTKKIF